MELRRALAKAAFRPLTPFVVPSARLPRNRLPRLAPSAFSQHGFHPSFSRTITQSSSSAASQPTTTLDDKGRENTAERPLQSQQQQQRPSRFAAGDEIDALLDSAMNTNTNRNRLPRSSASEFYDDAKRSAPRARGGREGSSSSGGFGGFVSGMDFHGLPGLEERAAVEQDVGPAPFRISASLGRSVEVSARNGGDLARALRVLDMRCAANRVRSDAIKQRFHERPGLRRKRLRGERWRKRFKMDFQATIRRVQELKRKGW